MGKTKDILPFPLREDETCINIANRIDEAFGFDLNKLLIYAIDNVPESVIDDLLWQFNVDTSFYRTLTSKKKKNLLKDAFKLTKYKGTLYPLQKIFDILGYGIAVKEWFDTGKSPFTFDVDVEFYGSEDEKVFFEKLVEKIRDLIERYKNVRSHLNVLKVFITNNDRDIPQIGIAIQKGLDMTVYPAEPRWWAGIDFQIPIFGLAVQRSLDMTVYPKTTFAFTPEGYLSESVINTGITVIIGQDVTVYPEGFLI